MFFETIIRQWDLNRVTPYADLNFSPEWVKHDMGREQEFNAIHFTPQVNRPMKQKARYGIPCSMRRRWWFVASGGMSLFQQVGNVWTAATAKTGPKIAQVSSDAHTFNANLVDFLQILWAKNQSIDYSPLIPSIASFLLAYMEKPLAYLSLQAMVNKSIREQYYFTLNKDQFLASQSSFQTNLHKKAKNLVNKAIALHLNVGQIGVALFPIFFTTLPLPIALVLFDSFIVEGRKVLYRFALNIFLQEQKKLLQASSPEQFIQIIFDAIDHINDENKLNSFIKTSFKLKIKRKEHIQAYEAQALQHQSISVSPPPQLKMAPKDQQRASQTLMAQKPSNSSFMNFGKPRIPFEEAFILNQTFFEETPGNDNMITQQLIHHHLTDGIPTNSALVNVVLPVSSTRD